MIQHLTVSAIGGGDKNIPSNMCVVIKYHACKNYIVVSAINNDVQYLVYLHVIIHTK